MYSNRKFQEFNFYYWVSRKLISKLGKYRKIQCHYNFLQNKVCDFVEDCTDYSDEATCPDYFQFDNCLDNWNDTMCWWKEEPVDQLDWIIAHGKNEDNLSSLLIS